MNFNIKNILGLLVCVAILASCNKDEGDVSTITEPQKYTFASLPEAIVVPEEAGTYEFTFTFDDKQIYDAHVILSANEESSATEDADYHLSTHAVDVSTLGGSGSFSVTVDEDFLPEGDETIVMDFSGDAPFNLPEAQKGLILTIQNKIYPPAIRLDWSTDFTFNGNPGFNACSFADVDMLILDEMGNEVSGFAAATGDCPEMVFADAVTADGTYDIVANLFDNETISGLVGGGIDSFAYNMHVTLFKGGVVPPEASTATYNTLDFDGVDKFYSYSPSDGDGERLITIGQVKVTNGEMVLYDPEGTEVGSFN